MDCEDQNFDHICDFCNLKLTKCEDLDKNHLCDVCKKTTSKCEEGELSDHICEYCNNRMSECQDKNKDHLCDVCLAELSQCSDTDNDHLCDVCEARLSDCVDYVHDYVCDMCGDLLPWLTVTIQDGCHVNGAPEDNVYNVLDSYKVSFEYAGFDGKVIAEWIIYDEDGKEYDRLTNAYIYYFTEGGSYHVVPIYAEN